MTHSRRAVLHLVEGTPDDGPADMTSLDRVHGRRSFWREPKEKLRRLLVERRLQSWINSEVHVLHCSLYKGVLCTAKTFF